MSTPTDDTPDDLTGSKVIPAGYTWDGYEIRLQQRRDPETGALQFRASDRPGEVYASMKELMEARGFSGATGTVFGYAKPPPCCPPEQDVPLNTEPNPLSA